MDLFLGKVTQQAMTYAIRSGISITATYALRQSTKLLKTAVDGTDKQELQALQERLQSKIRIISPAIDMIELISARGNTTLESAVTLTKSLRWDIQALGQRLAKAAEQEERTRKGSSQAQSRVQNELELKRIIVQLKKLLTQIEDAVPLINLAITTSGASLSTSLPVTISPSRLLQASTFLTAGDTQYSICQARSMQIGPTFVLSLYMLFAGHARPENEEDVRGSTWKEVIHKARVKLFRIPLSDIDRLPDRNPPLNANGCSESRGIRSPSDSSNHGGVRTDEYAYQIAIIEDFDDDRMHEFEDNEAKPTSYDDVSRAGIREAIPIHQISKIFYADTGKILSIGSDSGVNQPVLLLKRDLNAIPPRRMMEKPPLEGSEDEEYEGPKSTRPTPERSTSHQLEIDAQFAREHGASLLAIENEAEASDQKLWRIPPDLDPEWLALEVYTEAEDSDVESEIDETEDDLPVQARASSVDRIVTSALAGLKINGNNSPSSPSPDRSRQIGSQTSAPPPVPLVRTSLSLLETLLRLLSLQQFQQASHLSIPDEFLNFFLSESATTGAASGDDRERRRLRDDARRRVGFDPYDESPIKRRGEDYQYRGGQSQAGWEDGQEAEHYTSSPAEATYASEQYGYREDTPQTPPLRLQNRLHSHRSDTPGRSSPSLTRSRSNKDAREIVSPVRSPKSESIPGRVSQIRQEGSSRRGSPLRSSAVHESVESNDVK